MDNINNILLDYYDGAYGPTIRIDTQSIEALYLLKQLFMELSNSLGGAKKITDIDKVKVSGLTQLIFKNVLPKTLSKKRLLRKDNNATCTVFVLEMPSDEWVNAARLIDGMIEYGQPGHQYLSHEGIDDAILELTFME